MSDGGEIGPGARIHDYVVKDVLAEGGFGTVYRVEHALLGRPAALKMLHAELVSSDEAVARFEREAQAVNRIRHPNVVDIYDFGRLSDARPYFVMELLPGVDLERLIHDQGRLSAAEALDILAPVCDALVAAHDKGVVHRDIKASNVFLSARDGRRRVVLLDFGVAKLLDGQSDGITTSRHAVGTPTCMAPEQITGAAVDARTDVYALGALAYHMLVGELPFAGESQTMVQYMHMHARRPRPSARINLPAAVDDVIVRAMSIAPVDRHAGPGDFLAALRAAAGEQAPARSAQVRRAFAVHVDVRVDAAALEEPDDALLADMEAILPLAAALLEPRGFTVAVEAGNSMLLTLLLPDGDAADAGARGAGVAAALDLDRALRGRLSADARVRVDVALHAGRVLVAGGRIKGGDLMRLASWVPDAAVDGVVATPDAVAGLALAPDARLLIKGPGRA